MVFPSSYKLFMFPLVLKFGRNAHVEGHVSYLHRRGATHTIREKIDSQKKCFGGGRKMVHLLWSMKPFFSHPRMIFLFKSGTESQPGKLCEGWKNDSAVSGDTYTFIAKHSSAATIENALIASIGVLLIRMGIVTVLKPNCKRNWETLISIFKAYCAGDLESVTERPSELSPILIPFSFSTRFKITGNAMKYLPGQTCRLGMSISTNYFKRSFFCTETVKKL